MGIEERYQKPTWDYYISVAWRKAVGLMLSYPEFMFMAKILLGLVVAVLAFIIFKKVAGI